MWRNKGGMRYQGGRTVLCETYSGKNKESEGIFFFLHDIH